MIWACPLCKEFLAATPSGLGCVNNHQFDRAKEGYINLLPVQQKHSREPGDSRAMLQQRRAFLQQGYYQPLLDALVEVIGAAGPVTADFTLLDSGCGEGYYLAGLRERLGLAEACGLDIAKDAARLSAKLDKQLSCVVASSFALPVSDASVDCVMRIFAPGAASEVDRVLRDQGLFVVVSPGPSHMQELKALLLERADTHEPPALEAGFTLAQEVPLTFSNRLSNEGLSQLLGMTPLFWRVSPERQRALAEAVDTTVTADFIIRVYRKLTKPLSEVPPATERDEKIRQPSANKKANVNVWGVVDDN